MPTRKTAALSGRCLICGTDLCTPVFDCPSCATPHHSGCWQWTGGCAVYGCARRPRPVREAHRDEELARVAAAGERLRQPVRPRTVHRPAPPPELPEAHGLGALATAVMHLCLVAVFAFMGASLDASQRKAPAAAAAPAPRFAFRWPSTPTTTWTRHERQAEHLLRNDGLWEGNGTEPIAGLRRLMVAHEGEAVRSGLRQLARRDLPGWVRARLDALLAVDGAEMATLAALRRP